MAKNEEVVDKESKTEKKGGFRKEFIEFINRG